jgi:V/A-type H+-transporting ATPase subunit D
MAEKVKHTKNELKRQRDMLQRFERFLPTLQLKKQQLQMEVRNVEARLREHVAADRRLRKELDTWVRLFCEPVDFGERLRVREVVTEVGNVAGVSIPVLAEVAFDVPPPDLFATASWTDDGVRMLRELVRHRIERMVLEEQHRRLAEELRVTSQRVNLFEKVKIPESRENIRVIRIFLGDQQTAEIARSKIAKNKPRVLIETE